MERIDHFLLHFLRKAVHGRDMGFLNAVNAALGNDICNVGVDFRIVRQQIGFAQNPNVGACVIVGMACSDINGNEITNILSIKRT